MTANQQEGHSVDALHVWIHLQWARVIDTVAPVSQLIPRDRLDARDYEERKAILEERSVDPREYQGAVTEEQRQALIESCQFVMVHIWLLTGSRYVMDEVILSNIRADLVASISAIGRMPEVAD